MSSLELIGRKKEIKERIASIHHGITMINLHPKSVEAADFRGRYQSHLGHHGPVPKSERAQAELASLKSRMEQTAEIFNKAKAKEDALRHELKALQEELKNLSFNFSMSELKAANKRIAALQDKDRRVLDALEKHQATLHSYDSLDLTSPAIQREAEDLYAALEIGEDVGSSLEDFHAREGEYRKGEMNTVDAASRAKPLVAGLRRKLEEVRAELAKATEDAKELTRLYILDEIAKENQVYSELKTRIAESFTRVIALSELIPPQEASAIMPVNGAYRFFVPAFRLGQGDADEDFNLRCIDRPSTVAAEREKLIKQGASL